MIKTPLSTMIGGAFWTPNCTILGGTSKTFDQLIKSLFANGEQGFFYDPNDLSTMFQDAAGTIPVTAAGQPVGLMLDKSKGSVVGSNFNVMSKWGVTLCFTYTAPNLLISNRSGSTQYPKRQILTIGKWYKVSVTCSSVTGTIKFANQGGVITSTALIIGTTSAYILATDANLVWIIDNNSTATITGFTVQELPGNHAYQTVSASRPILQRNATTGAYYLEFDGADDFLKTANIDFTATDKVSLFAGVTKLADSGQIIAELSPSTSVNAGSFYLVAGTDNGGNGYVSQARGSYSSGLGTSARNFTYPAPDVAVLSVKHNISGDLSSMRRNGVIGIDGLGDKGAGNFGNYPLFIGRRSGTSLTFNGHLYGLIGIGRLTSDSETIALEKAIAKNTGVTLSV